MGDLAKRLAGPTIPGTSIGNVYGPVPTATKTIIRNIHVANTTDLAAVFYLSIGGSAVDTDASRIVDKASVPANGIFDETGFIVLAAGEYITAKQDTGGALTLTISGVEVS